eukprot:scaffold8041_cov64-Attheya_sp.AAC.1
MPTRETWIDAYTQDTVYCKLMEIIANPALIVKKSLEQERLVNSGNYVKLQIVPSEMQIIIFTAFRANPIGAHFS